MERRRLHSISATVGLICLISLGLVCGCEVNFEYNHDGEVAQSAVCPDETGANFGSYRLGCLGSLVNCSRGITLQFWIRPRTTDVRDNELVLISNGGHLPYSDGFFMKRNWNDQYTVGVSETDRTWLVNFRMMSGTWVHVAVTWNSTAGVMVYIDGFPVGSDDTGTARDFVSNSYIINGDVIVGGWTIDGDVNNGMTFDISNVSVINTVLAQDDIKTEIGQDPLLYLGCQSSAPNIDPAVLSSESTAVIDCRTLCESRGFLVARIDQLLRCTCDDLTVRDQVTPDNDCTSTGEARVYYVSHVVNSESFSLDISIEGSFGNSDINEMETVLITFTRTPDLPVLVHVDFGDGTSTTTDQSVVSHSWTTSGFYNIQASAIFGQVTKSETKTVEVKRLEEKVPPEYVAVVAYPDKYSYRISVRLVVVDSEVTTCRLYFGDGRSRTMRFTRYILSTSTVHVYKSPIGKYTLSADCSNSVGRLKKTVTVFTRKLEIDSSLLELGKYLSVKVRADVSVLNTFKIAINDEPANFKTVSNLIILPQTNFPKPGNYFITISTEFGLLMETIVLNVQGRMSLPSFTTDTLGVIPGIMHNYTVTLPPGDHFHACINMESMGFWCYYFDELTFNFPIYLRATYGTTGYYINTVETANDLSFESTVLRSTVDNPLVDIVVQAMPSTDLNEGIIFSVNINTQGNPPKIVQFHIEFGDGDNKTVEYINPDPFDFKIFHYQHLYDDWGVYNITVTASNSLTSVVDWDVVQLGQKLSFVDLTTDTKRVPLDSYAQVFVVIPSGTDITYRVDMGDGTSIQVPRSIFLSDASGKTSAESPSFFISAKQENKTTISFTDPTSLDKVIHCTADNATCIQIEDDRTLLINHKYAVVGMYDVETVVTNAFGTVSNKLCPTIIVDSPSTDSPPVCDRPVVTFPDLGSEEITIMRSKDVVVKVDPGLQCQDNITAHYSWQMNKVITEGGDDIQRPLTSVCYLLETNDTIVFPERSLEYGLYNLTVTVSPDGFDLLYSSRSVLLRIVPSPPVSSLGPMPTKISYIYSDTTLDLSDSKDPDVYNNPYIGCTYAIFCCKTDQQNTIQNKSLAQLTSDVSAIKTSGNLFPNSTNNTVDLYDSCGCFSSSFQPYFGDGKITFPSVQFTLSAVDFAFKLFVCKEGRCSTATQEIHLRSSNDSTEYGKLNGLLTSDDMDGALQLIGILTNDLNTLNGDLEGDKAMVEEAIKKRSLLINALRYVSEKLKTVHQIENTANALESVTSAKSQVTQNSRKSASSTMDNVAQAIDESGKEQSLDKVSDIGKGLVGSLSNLLPDKEQEESKLARELKKRRRRRSLENPEDEEINEDDIKCDIIKKLETGNPAGCNPVYLKLLDFFELDDKDALLEAMENDLDDIRDYVIPDLTEKKKEAEQKRLDADREVAVSGMAAVDKLANLFLDKISENDTVGLSSDKISVSVQKLNTNTSGNTTVLSETGSFRIPSSVLTVNSGTNASVGTKVVNSAVNQFTYGKGSNAITGGVITLTMTDGSGTDLEIRESDEPFEFWISAPALSQMTYHTIVLGKDEPSIYYHNVEIANDEMSLHIELQRSEESDQFSVYLSYMGFPNETHHDYSDVIPRDPNNVNFKNNKPCPDEEVRLQTIYPPRDLTRRNGTYRVGIKLRSAKIEVDKQQTNHTYGIRIFTSGCRYWNVSTDAWETTGCEVGSCTNYKTTQCLCNHLTSFGGNFVVPPNTIDFNTVFSKFAKLHENAAVFGTVTSILILYIILLIWGRYMDKKDIQKWGALPLEDNLPSDTYHYQLAVCTGVKKGAETDSKISFILSGDDNDTGVRCLYDGKRKHIEKGSVMNYILSVESALGPLTFLRIWHDNSGKGKKKGWYLDQVEVTDLQNGERFFFLCGRWLAVEEDDGQVERILPVAGLNDLIAFKHLFSSNVRKKLSNDHLWFSVFSRPTRSKFTRCQRISCCLSLLFLTMITNAMWFKTENNAGPVTALKIGPFSFTLQQVFISFASTMIVFPVSFLLITIFKKARSKKNSIIQTGKQESKKSQKYKWKSVNNPPNTWGDVEKSKKDKFKDSMKNIISFHNRKYESEEVAAAIEEENLQKTGKKKKKKPLTFPRWTIYIGWFLVFVSVTASAFFTILYSLEWGTEKANDWLITFLMSFFQSVVVVQPVKVLLMVAFIACILKKPEINEEEGLEEEINTSHDEELLAKTPENITAIMLQRKMAAQELQPPDLKALEAARELRLKEMKMEVIIKEIIIYAFFVLVLFFISYQTRDSQSYQYASHLRNIFFSSANGLSFDKISTHEEYWTWTESVLIPQMYASEWLNGDELKWWDKRCINDLESRRVGIGRLRQMRIKENSCTVADAMSTIFKNCRNAYDWTADDTKTYAKKWQNLDEENKTAEEMKNSPWDYQNSIELKNAPYYGSLVTYKGGGYVVNFERTANRTSKLIEELKENAWIDVRTRAVFLEFTVYNPNTNLFASVVMVTEFGETGGSVKRGEFKVFRLFSYVGAFGTVVLLFEIIYACFTLYFLIHAIKKLKKDRLKYFKCFWSVLEFILLGFSVACIVMYAFKHVLASYALDELHEAGSADFVNFQSLALYDELFGYMVGIVVFLATIQFLKMLQFNRRMNMLGDTIRLATKDLKNFSVMFMIYFMAFCQLAYLLFGRTMVTYDNFVSSVESMFAFCLGSFEFDEMQDSQRVLGPIFFFLFVGIVYIGLMGMFVTIIYDSFASVKADVTLRTNEHEIVDFMWKRLKGLIKG